MIDTAVVTYIDDSKTLIQEFHWLYKSWIYSGSWRTSKIIAFHHPSIDMNLLPKEDVLYIPLIPLTERDEIWKEYPFINSVEYLTRPEASVLAQYKYILRTDNDCFLTPNFQSFKPRLATFGIGMYATQPIVVAKLAQIAAQWGIQPIFNNVGSTLMAKSNQVLQYSQLQMEYCRKLRAEEFPDGYGEWPNWYFGVLTMYAGQLAANAFFGMNMTMGGFDVHCMSHEEMKPTDYHIHAWHTYDNFSKFKWREGKYSKIDRSALDPNIIADYCLWIAGNTPCE